MTTQSNNNYSLNSQLTTRSSVNTVLEQVFEHMLWGNNHPGEMSESLLDVFGVYSVAGDSKKFTIADKLRTDAGGTMGVDITDDQRKHWYNTDRKVTNVTNESALLTPTVYQKAYFISEYGDEFTATDRAEEIFGEQIPLFSKTKECEKAADSLHALFSRDAAGAITGNGSTTESRANTVAASVLAGTTVDTFGQYTLGGDATAAATLNAGHIMATADKAVFENFKSFLLIIPVEDWSPLLANSFFADAESRAAASYGMDVNPIFRVRAVRTYTARPEMGIMPMAKTYNGFNRYTGITGGGNTGRMFAIKVGDMKGGGLLFGKHAGKAVNRIKVEEKGLEAGTVVVAFHDLGVLSMGYNIVDCAYKTGIPDAAITDPNA